MPLSWMKRNCSSKIPWSSLSKPTMNPRVDVEARVLDPRQLGGQRIAPEILELLRLLQRRVPRRLDADEHAAEVGPVHQLQQFGIVGQVDAGLGGQPQRIAVLLHPGDDLLQQRLGLLLVADEVVVDDERRVEAGPAHVVQFGHQLLGLLDPRPAPVDHDDVAELALERAAARVLQRPGGVPIDLQQVVARARHLRHVGRLRLFVPRLDGVAAGEVVEELRARSSPPRRRTSRRTGPRRTPPPPKPGGRRRP